MLPPAEQAALSSAKPRALADRHGAGHPRSHAAEEGRAGGLLHEHTERGAAGAEVSPVLPVSPCPPQVPSQHAGLFAPQVPQWHPWLHEGSGAGPAAALPASGDAVPAR